MYAYKWKKTLHIWRKSILSRISSNHTYLWRKRLLGLLIIPGMLPAWILLRGNPVHVLWTVRHWTVRKKLLRRKTAGICSKILHSTLDWPTQRRVPELSAKVPTDQLPKWILKPLNIRHTFVQSLEDVDSSCFTRRIKQYYDKWTTKIRKKMPLGGNTGLIFNNTIYNFLYEA